MSVIWSGVTEEGAVVPVQVTDEGKVVAIGDGPQGDYLPITGGTLTGDLNVADGISLKTDGSAEFKNTVRVDYPNNTGADNLLRLGNSNNGGDKSAHLFLAAGYYVSPSSLDGTGYLAKISATDGSAQFASGNFNIYKEGSFYFYRPTNSSSFSLVDAYSDVGGTRNKVFTLKADGSATFVNDGVVVDSVARITAKGYVKSDEYIWAAPSTGYAGIYNYATNTSSSTSYVQRSDSGLTTIEFSYSGSAEFSGDVIIGSRGEKWLIRESNGVAMLVQQSREAAPMGVSPMIPEKVRDIPNELDLIEMALNEVMEKLRMTPPAGWPVWDGSDNP